MHGLVDWFFHRHGRKVIAFFCGWELLALIPHSPVPTISSVVDVHPWVGWVLLGALGYHWYAGVHPDLDVIGHPVHHGSLAS